MEYRKALFDECTGSLHGKCGFVSGHDFSRAVKAKKSGLQPLRFFSEWHSVQILRRQGLKSLRENSRIWEVRGAHRRSLGFARDDNFVWERQV